MYCCSGGDAEAAAGLSEVPWKIPRLIRWAKVGEKKVLLIFFALQM